MARVFLLSKKTDANESQFADALGYGSLNFLIGKGEYVDFYNLDEASEWLKGTLLPKFKFQEDFILLIGNVMINSLAISLLINEFPTVQILLYDSRKNEYILRILTKQHLLIRGDKVDKT